MPLQVYTAQFSYKGANRLDVTVKGKSPFAPTWKMVMDYKNKIITAEEYTKMYNDLMNKSYKNNRVEWDDLLARESVTLVCYCPSYKFCHRLLLAKRLVELGATYKGEISKKPMMPLMS